MDHELVERRASRLGDPRTTAFLSNLPMAAERNARNPPIKSRTYGYAPFTTDRTLRDQKHHRPGRGKAMAGGRFDTAFLLRARLSSLCPQRQGYGGQAKLRRTSRRTGAVAGWRDFANKQARPYFWCPPAVFGVPRRIFSVPYRSYGKLLSSTIAPLRPSSE